MVCTYDHKFGCSDGYNYGYNYEAPSCCNAGMSMFWQIFLWILLALCMCLCISTCIAMMRRRRMQAMRARNHGADPQHVHHNSSHSSDDSIHEER